MNLSKSGLTPGTERAMSVAPISLTSMASMGLSARLVLVFQCVEGIDDLQAHDWSAFHWPSITNTRRVIEIAMTLTPLATAILCCKRNLRNTRQ
jgi:hypothetical protein